MILCDSQLVNTFFICFADARFSTDSFNLMDAIIAFFSIAIHYKAIRKQTQK